MDLEDEGEGRRHGGRVLCGSGGNKKGGMRKITAGELARLRLATSFAASRVCQRGSLVTPKHVS